MVDIKGLDKAEVLHALWHASHSQGLSFLGVKGNFTIERARELINSREDRHENDQYRLYFDYVDGHVIKCNLTGDTFDERLFDRDCGEGRAQIAIDELRNGTNKNYEYDPMMDLMAGLFKSMADEAMLKENKTEEK